jgi:hypothetical protein
MYTKYTMLAALGIGQKSQRSSKVAQAERKPAFVPPAPAMVKTDEGMEELRVLYAMYTPMWCSQIALCSIHERVQALFDTLFLLL